MKKSELKNEIKNYIYEILSEVDVDPKSGAVVMKKGTNPNDIKKVTSQGIDVELREVSFEEPDFRINKTHLQQSLDFLEKTLSPEGWEIIKKYVKGADKGGWNRPYSIIRLAWIFGNDEVKKSLGPGTPTSERSINKTDLRSYSNKDLFGLIDSGDLVLKGKKYYPSNSLNLNEEEDSTESYAVILKGGSIGDKNNKPIKIFNTPEEAKEFAKRRNQQLSPGEKSYYKMSYNVIKLPKNLNEEEDSTPDDETIDKQAKAAAKKEKIQGPSKFKISDEKYKELKSKLKTVVEKVKDLDKKIKDPNTKKSELEDLKDQKSKKMEALKKFMKNDELVKAFKERDVKIDTDGLVD